MLCLEYTTWYTQNHVILCHLHCGFSLVSEDAFSLAENHMIEMLCSLCIGTYNKSVNAIRVKLPSNCVKLPSTAHCHHGKSESHKAQVGTAKTTAKPGCSKERHCAEAVSKEARAGTTSVPYDGIYGGGRRPDDYRCGGGVRAVCSHARPSGKVDTTKNSSTRAEGAPHAASRCRV